LLCREFCIHYSLVMGNKLQKLGIHSGSTLGSTEFTKVWESYKDEKEDMSYGAAHKFLKDFSSVAGMSYVDRLAEVIIVHCDKENTGKLNYEQFEWLFYYTAQATGFNLDEDVQNNRGGEVVKRIFKQNLKLLGDQQKEEGRYSLCFPSISTSVYKFNIERAAKVATKVIKEFLLRYPDIDIRLCLVDITESETLDAFRKQRATEEINDPRYIIQRANITLLRDYGIQSWYIVNASNPSFHGRGSGTNRAIHSASNCSLFNLEKETRKLYSKNAKTAQAYPVELREGSPLRELQGVRTVIHVVGPNMSPKRPRYLEQNYEKGEKLLKRAYESILRTFLRQIKVELVDDSTEESEEEIKEKKKKKPKTEIKVIDESDDKSSGEDSLSHSAPISPE